MRILVDTERYLDFCKGLQVVVEAFQLAGEVGIPSVVLGELRAGFMCGPKGWQNERVVRLFLKEPRVRVYYPDKETIKHFASVFSQLR